ncbi:MAG: lolA [Burkholderiales bacterium]|jgi:NAD+ synthase (glutamine-hydrolysing)/outer membrane lipoprotein carrier protein|nr:lolA [Burkholderiales bacterium]
MFKKIIFLSMSISGSIVYADAIKSLDMFLQNKQITGDFTQTVYGNKKNRVSLGSMQILRPNKFRWEYKDGQLIISNSKDIYIYDKELKQVTIKKLNSSLGKSPALLLAGGTNIKKSYTISSGAKSDGLEWVNLNPKTISDNNGFKSVSMGFAKNTGLLSQMKFIDSFDNKSAISFTNVKVGKEAKTSADDFKFKPPIGVDIINSDN